MLSSKKFSVVLFVVSMAAFSCNNFKNTEAKSDTNSKIPANTATAVTTENAAINNLHCTITIEDKKFIIPADSISTAYELEDSSLTITFKGFEQGRLLLRIPNFFKAPCKIPTGYSSSRTKELWVNSAGVASTTELLLYPTEATSFNNLNDGRNLKAIVPDAAEITAVQKISEDKSEKMVYYLVTGKIHTTVLKNVFHTDAGEQNKDYKINGDFTIKAHIYYLD